MTATIETGCQTKGPTTEQFSFLFYHISKRAADDLVIQSLDPRVGCLSFLWRVDGKFGRFTGQPVENVDIDRALEYISVDWLISEADWQGRSLPQLVDLLANRLDGTPPVLELACAKRKVAIDASALRVELSEYARRMRELCARFDPMTRWIPPAVRPDPTRFADPWPT